MDDDAFNGILSYENELLYQRTKQELLDKYNCNTLDEVIAILKERLRKKAMEKEK